ncbi:MAG: undecaprenyldiphospho-muramoylpentapeptide beta-N-acetylglucosaminyltransferase [bacterium]
MRILFTGGGTGGHIFPLIAVARQLKRIYFSEEGKPLEMFFLGSGGFKNALNQEGIKTKTILTGKIRRYFSVLNILDIFKMPIGFLQTLWYLFIWMPDVVFNKGSYASAPVVITAWIYRIPILTHESDIFPGLSNRFAAKFSKKIAISFSQTEKYFPQEKTALIGNPIRMEIIQTCLSTNENDKNQARKILNLTSDKPIIFISGGSQGAQKINEVVLRVLPKLTEKYEIIHQCGVKNYEQIKKIFDQSSTSNYRFFSFLDEKQLSAAYLLADLIISRAGAISIFKIAACHKPSILIPLQISASDHQRQNAFAYARAGATSVLEESNLTPNLFLNEISKILEHPEISKTMSVNAESFSMPEAAQRIAEELIEMVK